MLHSGFAQNGKDFKNVLRLKNRFIADYEGFLNKGTVAACAGNLPRPHGINSHRSSALLSEILRTKWTSGL